MAEIYPYDEKLMEDWPYISIDDSFATEIHAWIDENIEGDWTVIGASGFPAFTICFEKEEDAAAFKLKWT